MSIDSEMRMQRITRLLRELEYEVGRGFMEAEIDEQISFRFVIPVSRQIVDGVVDCRFETRPIHRHSMMARDLDLAPRLKLVTDHDAT